MSTDASQVLAASAKGGLWLIVVGIAVAVVLLGAFIFDRRLAARRRRSTPPPGGVGPTGNSGEAQRGETWQTPDDDSDQGHPRP